MQAQPLELRAPEGAIRSDRTTGAAPFKPVSTAQLTGPAVFIGLYETLFTPTDHRALCRFLSIPEQIADLSHRVNASQPTASVPAEVLQRLSQHFAPLVTAVQERAPDLQVEQHWATAMRWRGI